MRSVSGKRQKAVVIFGGTFDPVHYGHLRTALEVRNFLAVQEIKFLPAGSPPHRRNEVSDPHHRLAMLQLALAGLEGFSIDQREIQRRGLSFMVDTLTDIRSEGSNNPVILVLGHDSASSLGSWHRWLQIFSLAHLLVISRPGEQQDFSPQLDAEMSKRQVLDCQQLFEAPSGLVLNLQVTGLSISSRNIRRLMKNGGSAQFLLPDTVLGYLHEHRLYS